MSKIDNMVRIVYFNVSSRYVFIYVWSTSPYLRRNYSTRWLFRLRRLFYIVTHILDPEILLHLNIIEYSGL